MFKKITLIVACVFLLSACGKKTKTTNNQPTSTPQTGGVWEMVETEKPYISLTPTSDGHWLNLKITKLSSNISAIEYELIYNAIDNNMDIEKGVSGTIKSQEISTTIERKLLLGTESCTSGCKYKYDTGVIGGTLSINFISQDGKTATYQTPFSLKSTANLKKEGFLKLETENYSLKAPVSSGSDYYLILKNYNGVYSVFSSNSNSSLIGDHQ